MTDKEIKFGRIAKEYELDKEGLEEAYKYAEKLRKKPRQPPKLEQKKPFQEVQKYILKLHQALSSLSDAEKELMDGLFTEGHDVVSQVDRDILHLAYMTEIAETRIDSFKNRSRNWHFIFYMADFWFEQKEKLPTCNHNKDGYFGKFYEFMTEFPDFKYGKGSTIRDAVREWTYLPTTDDPVYIDKFIAQKSMKKCL